MADKPSSKASKKTEPLNKKEENERQKKEVASKLHSLPPMAKAEIVNEVLNKQVSKQFGGFTNFLREQSVIGIGIGLVFGTQMKTVVDSIMLGLVNPITQLFLPGKQKLSDLTWAVSLPGSDKEALIHWGNIVYTLINFVFVALTVYVIFRLFKLDRLKKKD